MVADSVKIQVLADLLTGRTVSAVARKHSLSRPTVRQIRAKLIRGGSDAVGAAIERQRLEIDDLLMDALKASMEASSKILEAVGDREYLLKYSPRQNAKLLEVVGNQFIELLAILDRRERWQEGR